MLGGMLRMGLFMLFGCLCLRGGACEFSRSWYILWDKADRKAARGCLAFDDIEKHDT
jgi:hypothetical protein